VVTAPKRNAENQGTRNDPSKREETLPPLVDGIVWTPVLLIVELEDSPNVIVCWDHFG